MKFRDYFKDELFSIVLFFLILIFIFFLLLLIEVDKGLLLYILLALLLYKTASFLYGYFRKRRFYDLLAKNLEGLNEKYFISNLIDAPSFWEGKILCNVLSQVGESMATKVNEYKYSSLEFTNYLQMWIHEIKTPLASSMLILQNSPGEMSASLMEENEKMALLLEQILFYARSESAEKDCILHPVKLSIVVNFALVSLRKNFLGANVSLELENLKCSVVTDKKWLGFVVTQILLNSLQYTSASPKPRVKIWESEDENEVVLFIRDNGIGIAASDIPYVFDRGFTGENGRKRASSTGMGLFIVKNLLDKLGHKITVTSPERKGTLVSITFAKNKFINLE